MSQVEILPTVIFIFAVFIASFSQILLKKSADSEHKNFIQEYINKRVIIAYTLFFLSSILATLMYSHLELKYGPILDSLSNVFILILSKIYIGEKLTKDKIIGNLLIIIGVIIFSI